MNARAARLIESLGLIAHPEGGWFREVYRSLSVVTPADGPGRQAITSIFFLLADGARSRWHSVASDEIWHWYEGDPLELITVSELTLAPRRTVVGPVADGRLPVAVVRPHEWQAARSLGEYTLVGCTVAPGFDFADFRMLADDDVLATRFRTELPDYAEFI